MEQNVKNFNILKENVTTGYTKNKTSLNRDSKTGNRPFQNPMDQTMKPGRDFSFLYKFSCSFIIDHYNPDSFGHHNQHGLHSWTICC